MKSNKIKTITLSVVCTTILSVSNCARAQTFSIEKPKDKDKIQCLGTPSNPCFDEKRGDEFKLTPPNTKKKHLNSSQNKCGMACSINRFISSLIDGS